MAMIREHLRQHDSPEMPLNPDGHALNLGWPSVGDIGPLSMERLPSLDYALYLTNTVKFHLGQMYHLFDERTFMQDLHQFYSQGPRREPLPERRCWYIHYLLVMAFGKALLSGCVGEQPVGSEFASRAIKLLPDSFGLYQDPILSIEILSCLALYLQSIDHRNSAYLYVRENPLPRGFPIIQDRPPTKDYASHYILDRASLSYSSKPGTSP